MITITEAATSADFEAIRSLLREYLEWAYELTEGNSSAPTYEGAEEAMTDLPGQYSRPGGRLLLARVGSEPAGCIALKRHDAAEAELKRLYVRPAHRRMKIGRRLVTALLDEARSAGYRRVILDSHIKMASAHAIYRASGFRDVTAPDVFPAALKPLVVFMELDLQTVN